MTPSAAGFDMSKGVGAYGGFSNTGSRNFITQRDSLPPYSTVLSASNSNDVVVLAGADNWDISPVKNLALNSLQIEGYGSIGLKIFNAKNFKIANCDVQKFNKAGDISGTGELDKVSFHHNTLSNESQNSKIVEILAYLPTFSGKPEDKGVTCTNCNFSDNLFGTNGGWIVYFFDGQLTFVNPTFLDYGTGTYQLGSNSPYPSAVLTFRGCTVRGGRDAIGHGGTLNYDSSNHEP